ncbi:hypothetical protein N0V90_001122 [Kalmusia sp. IMI 367209]|nr:hypothetical protein N0V90_001122 [Kalmusia sp. IMI 367209]
MIVSKHHHSIDVQVPNTFTSLEIIAAANANIHISSTSTYCNVSFTQWNKRNFNKEHILTLRPRIYIEVPDYEFPAEEVAPPFDYTDDDEAELVATNMKDQVESTPTLQVAPRHSNALPWLMGAAGAGASIGTAAYLVTNFEFGIAGAYVSCGPVTAAIGGATGTMSLAAAGGLTLGAGVAAVAAVYFIPWSKLAKWAAKAWDLFLIFLKSIWECVKWVWGLFVRFVKVLIKAMRDVVTHLTNAMRWMGSMMYASTFG